MRYEGNTCPGCGEVFTAEADVVVCPECATAQHRECSNKKGECVNAHLHGDGFEWKPEKGISQKSTSTLVNDGEDKSKRVFECPGCGNMCDPDMQQCDRCGTKFVVFGVNLAKKIQSEIEKTEGEIAQQGQNADSADTQESIIPPYEPPFTLGEGEGFEYDERKPDVRDENVNRVTQSIIENLIGQSNNSAQGEDDTLFFSGPFKADDKIEGVSANAIGSFVRTEALKYIEKFRKISRTGSSFNWAALFLSPYWFFYRRLIKPGIIFMTIELVISIFTTYFSYDMMAAMMSADMETMDEQAIFEFMSANMTESAVYIFICMAVMLTVRIAAGFMADKLYKRYVIDHVKVMQKKRNMNEAMVYAMKNGGASILFGMASFFAYELLGYAIGMFFA